MFSLWLIDVLKQLSVFFFILLLILLSRMLGYIYGFNEILPWLTLIPLWYWTINNPRVLSVSAIILVGIIEDLQFINIPLGINPIILVMFYWIIISQRGFLQGNNFIVTWLLFAIMSALAIIFKWFFICLLDWNFYPPIFIPSSWLITIGIYPIIVKFFVFWNKTVFAAQD